MTAQIARLILLLKILPFCSCGIRTESFIHNLDITKANFTVIVLCTNSKYFCSGVIVDVSWVLTAAHCFHDLYGRLTEDNTSVKVVAGANKLQEVEAAIKSGEAQIRASRRIVSHEHFIWAEKFINNLALIELKEPFNVTKTVDVVKLIRTDKNVTTVVDHHAGIVTFSCFGYGYGSVLRSRRVEGDDKIKGQKYLADKHCHCLEKIRSRKQPYDILMKRNIFVCDADSDPEETGLCAGDGGGPLVCEDTLRAVASTVFQYNSRHECRMLLEGENHECGDVNTLNVFTDLCYFNPWLRSWLPNYPPLDDTCKPTMDNYYDEEGQYDSTINP